MLILKYIQKYLARQNMIVIYLQPMSFNQSNNIL